MALSTLAIGLIAGFGSAALLIFSSLTFLLYRRQASPGPQHTEQSAKKGHRLTITNLNDHANPEQLIILSTVPSDPEKGWAPQIQNYSLPYGASFAAGGKKAQRDSFGSARRLATGLSTPPPVYKAKLHTPSSSLDKSLWVSPPISPPVLKTDFSPKRESGVVGAPFALSPTTPTLLSPNPRTASLHSKVSSTTASLLAIQSVPTSFGGPDRILQDMVVCATFTPTRDDEMTIAVGERLRVHAHFEDHWSLVQRVGHTDEEYGVVPTFCIVEPTNAY